MTWDIQPAGSWAVCTTDSPEVETPAALALEGSFLWHSLTAGDCVLVRSDQLSNLIGDVPPASAPPVINDYYPKPAPSGGEMLIGGSALDTTVRIDIVPQGETVLSVLPPYELQLENEVRFISPDRLSGPATIAAYNSANETGGAFDMEFA
jgi:hypothetical protein